MSFSGKKFRRLHYENIHEIMRSSNVSPQTMHLMTSNAPVFSFIRLDELNFIFKLILSDRIMSQKFRLGEEFEMERRNGTKIRVTFTLESDDVLNQIIKHPDGRVTRFRREFGTSNKMIITTTGMTRSAIIYYEQVN